MVSNLKRPRHRSPSYARSDPGSLEDAPKGADSDSRVHLPSDSIQVTTAAQIPIDLMGEKLDWYAQQRNSHPSRRDRSTE
ncbi:MAG: hypothetical protein L0L93_14910, partial [Brevibacterium sp.]|nr:hypothetical protein [Brevibacterium sp.]